MNYRSKQHCSDYRLSAAKSKKLVEDIIEVVLLLHLFFCGVHFLAIVHHCMQKGHVAEEEIDRLRQWIDFLSNVSSTTGIKLKLFTYIWIASFSSVFNALTLSCR